MFSVRIQYQPISAALMSGLLYPSDIFTIIESKIKIIIEYFSYRDMPPLHIFDVHNLKEHACVREEVQRTRESLCQSRSRGRSLPSDLRAASARRSATSNDPGARMR